METLIGNRISALFRYFQFQWSNITGLITEELFSHPKLKKKRTDTNKTKSYARNII